MLDLVTVRVMCPLLSAQEVSVTEIYDGTVTSPVCPIIVWHAFIITIHIHNISITRHGLPVFVCARFYLYVSGVQLICLNCGNVLVAAGPSLPVVS